jgi:hypothetical protein
VFRWRGECGFQHSIAFTARPPREVEAGSARVEAHVDPGEGEP